MLRCTDSVAKKKIFYIGFTDNLRARLNNHLSKNTQTTKKFDKIELVYYEACLNKTDAIRRENELKTGFGRGYIKKRLKEYLKDSQR